MQIRQAAGVFEAEQTTSSPDTVRVCLLWVGMGNARPER